MISLGLKKLCAKIRGCKIYIKVARMALLFEPNSSLEKKKKKIIPIKWKVKFNLCLNKNTSFKSSNANASSITIDGIPNIIPYGAAQA